jgi:hypothetical protein
LLRSGAWRAYGRRCNEYLLVCSRTRLAEAMCICPFYSWAGFGSHPDCPLSYRLVPCVSVLEYQYDAGC